MPCASTTRSGAFRSSSGPHPLSPGTAPSPGWNAASVHPDAQGCTATASGPRWWSGEFSGQLRDAPARTNMVGGFAWRPMGVRFPGSSVSYLLAAAVRRFALEVGRWSAPAMVLSVLLAACGPEEADETVFQCVESTDPTVVLLSPAENVYIEQTPPATPVAVTGAVSSWAPFPAAGKEIRFFLDGKHAGSNTQAAAFTFPDVPMGMHTLSAVLYQQGIPLPVPSATASRKVKVTVPCKKKADCEEGNPCSIEACVSIGNGEYRCHWGPVYSCCFSLFDCPFGMSWCKDLDGNGKGECLECLEDGECDDGNPCSVDHCIEGTCNHLPAPGSCATDAQCNDGNLCTVDVCQAESCQCTHAQIPQCCTAPAQCDDNSACTLDACIANECRHGPKQPGVPCCVADKDCASSNPCKAGVCDKGGSQTGLCKLSPDPNKPGCCSADSQCPPLSDKFLGKCINDAGAGYPKCSYALNPEWCDPAAWGLRINELMVDPAGVPDALGEWVELFNAGGTPVELSGHVLSGGGGEACILAPEQSFPVAAGSLVLVGRTADPK
ncbi:MAG: lamin tail domain-containing protein, partial [Deltaproteobacteria bacterium]|nr:lamin tail domain-containing protein [Deltaproteobacteria bacterium]